MKGNNTISLNAATVIEALQEYFNKRSKEGFAPFTVKSVKAHSGMSFELEVDVEGRDQDPSFVSGDA